MHEVVESLAGRILIKELLPFTLVEYQEGEFLRVKNNLLSLFDPKEIFLESEKIVEKSTILGFLISGGFPQVNEENNETFRDNWFNSYLETNIQRDIRSLSAIQNLGQFSRFVQLIAGRTAKIINHSELGKDIGVTYKTVQHYLSLLEAAYLIGVTSVGLERSPLFGHLFESYVITELLKLSKAFNVRVHFSHFRAGNKEEIDLVIEYQVKVIPIEIKASGTIDASWTFNLSRFKEIIKLPPDAPGYVFSLNSKFMPLGRGNFNIPIQSFC